MPPVCAVHVEVELDGNGLCDECNVERAWRASQQLVPSVKCQRCHGPVVRRSASAGSNSPYLHRWNLFCKVDCTLEDKSIGWIEFDDSEPAFEHVQQVLDGFTINMRGGRPEGLRYPREGEFADWKAILKARVDEAKKVYEETPDDGLSNLHRTVWARYREALACFEALFGPVDAERVIP